MFLRRFGRPAKVKETTGIKLDDPAMMMTAKVKETTGIKLDDPVMMMAANVKETTAIKLDDPVMMMMAKVKETTAGIKLDDSRSAAKALLDLYSKIPNDEVERIPEDHGCLKTTVGGSFPSYLEIIEMYVGSRPPLDVFAEFIEDRKRGVRKNVYKAVGFDHLGLDEKHLECWKNYHAEDSNGLKAQLQEQLENCMDDYLYADLVAAIEADHKDELEPAIQPSSVPPE